MELAELLATAVGYVWSTWLVVLLVLTGIYLTIRLGVPQLHGFAHAINILRGKYDDEEDDGQINHFQALSAALSATVGLGNIAGVSIAIGAGGPGAVFWMWTIGFIGMATKATSCTLAVKYREVLPDGTILGGPMYYIERGLGKTWRPLAILFATLVAIAAFGGGNMFQSNQAAAAMWENYHVPTEITGLALAFGVGLVIIGGIRRIGKVAGSLVPAMVFVYMLGAFAVMAKHLGEVPAAFALIFTDAFSGQAVAGGAIGEVIRQGVRRGTFSNEAGIGSAPIAHAAARTREPTREGLVASLGPFIDTIVVCTLTAMVIILSGTYKPFGSVEQVDGDAVEIALTSNATPYVGDRVAVIGQHDDKHNLHITSVDREQRRAQGRLLEGATASALAPGNQVTFGTGVRLTTAAFDDVFFGFGRYFVPIAVLLFAFSTMIAWSYYGVQGIHYLLGARAVLPYRFAFVLAVVAGALWQISPVVNFSDIAFGLMAVPNVIALWLLAGRVRAEHNDYFQRMRAQTDTTKH